MNSYKFNYDDIEYTLSQENCSDLINDDEKPVSGISVSDIIDILNKADSVDFDIEYYQEACPECLAGVKEKQ